MALFDRFIEKQVEKQLKVKLVGLKAQVKQEIEEERPESAAYMQGWQEEDEKEGRPTRVSYKTLESLYTKESWVRAAIDVIVRSSTSAGYRFIPSAEEDNADEVKQTECYKDIVKLFEQPNSENSFEELAARIITDLHIYGDAYLELVLKDDKIVAIYNIYAPSVRVLVNKHGTVQGYLQVMDGGLFSSAAKGIFFEEEQIVHFKLNNPGNEVYGLSPLESLFVPIESDLYAQAYNRDFFKNNATPRLHIDMGNCTYAQLKRNRHYWNSEFRGARNAHKTIITEGGAKINPIGTPPKDMEFLNQRKFSRDEILAVFGVPPIKVGVYEDANRSNAKEQDKTFKAEKILPMQKIIAQKINRKIISKFDCPVKFAFNPIDLRDAKDQADIDGLHLESGSRTINELRARDGFKSVAWGNWPLMNNRIVPLEIKAGKKQKNK